METTQRYKGNVTCAYNSFKPLKDDVFWYGCEFEFYLCSDYTIDNVRDALRNITPCDILVDMTYLPAEEDKDWCMQIKSDASLGENGVEISVPISTKEGILHFIEQILPIIGKFGYTDSDTGLHLHMSVRKNKHVDFYLFMLLCNEKGLLDAWLPRVGYSQNVMDVLSICKARHARTVKRKKGPIWNLEKVENGHIEIRTIGGKDYHKEPARIKEEFLLYADLFEEATKRKTSEHIALIQKQKERVEKSDSECQKRYAFVLQQAGLLPRS